MFNNPESISPKEVFDLLVFHVKNKSENFIAKRELVDLHDDYTTLVGKIKRQMLDNSLNRGIESGSNSSETFLKASVLATLVLSIFFAGPLSLLVGFINALQLIIHLPTFNVAFPANVMTFFRALIPIVMFDIFENIGEFLPEDMQKEEEEEILNIQDQTVDLGYDSHSPVGLLGTLGALTALYFVKVVVYYILVKPCSSRQNLVKIEEKMRK